jgi:hypothetical protein
LGLNGGRRSSLFELLSLEKKKVIKRVIFYFFFKEDFWRLRFFFREKETSLHKLLAENKSKLKEK